MKKQIVAVALGLSMVAFPAFAHGTDDNQGKSESAKFMGLKLGVFEDLFGGKADSNQFLVSGTIATVGTNSFTVNVKYSANVANITNGVVTVTTDANTKENQTLAVGQNVVATGSVSSSDLLASKVQVMGANPAPKPKPKKNVAVGKVTATTANSVTITNTLTNTSQTIPTDPNTQVKIDGQAKTVSDINVGDSGWIRFKTEGANLIAKIIHLFR